MTRCDYSLTFVVYMVQTHVWLIPRRFHLLRASCCRCPFSVIHGLEVDVPHIHATDGAPCKLALAVLHKHYHALDVFPPVVNPVLEEKAAVPAKRAKKGGPTVSALLRKAAGKTPPAEPVHTEVETEFEGLFSPSIALSPHSPAFLSSAVAPTPPAPSPAPASVSEGNLDWGAYKYRRVEPPPVIVDATPEAEGPPSQGLVRLGRQVHAHTLARACLLCAYLISMCSAISRFLSHPLRLVRVRRSRCLDAPVSSPSCQTPLGVPFPLC